MSIEREFRWASSKIQKLTENDRTEEQPAPDRAAEAKRKAARANIAAAAQPIPMKDS